MRPPIRTFREGLEALADVRPMAERLRRAFGVRGTAQLLRVDPANFQNYLAGKRPLGAEIRHNLIDLDHVLTQAAQVFVGEAIVHWLTGHSQAFGGARPLDVLATNGSAPLLQEIERIRSGGYA